MDHIFELGKVPESKLGLIGGKALSLDRMIKDLKVMIPGGYVITADAFSCGSIPQKTADEISSLVSSLNPGYSYAVRSSALNEDGENASFAGQYETLTDIAPDRITDAVRSVISSSSNARVKGYTETFVEGGNADGSFSENSPIAVVVQRFVKPEFAGVVFTSDVITGRDEYMVGNYVEGEGEKLVSGAENAREFRIGAISYSYEGDEIFSKHARRLGKYCKKIRHYYGMPMDIEWAVSKGKVYILQARPITTLKRLDMRSYDINGTRSGYKLLTRTNVGEIFLRPVTPMTFSVLEKINVLLGLPDWLDNICGQPYMNVSVMCSVYVSLGFSRKRAFEGIKDLVGNVPDGVDIPVSPFDRRAFLRSMKQLIFPKNKSKLTKKEKHHMVMDLPVILRGLMEEIRSTDNCKDLYTYWEDVMLPRLLDGLSAIMAESGTSILNLFKVRKKIRELAGEEMENRLCGGTLGNIASMKPLLLLEDLIEGRITREEYVNTCGQRSAGEMELAEPRPYEDPSFPDALIEEHLNSGVDLHAMMEKQTELFEEALEEFKTSYPSKKKWIDKQIAKYTHANEFREDIRSKGVWIFSLFREYILKAGELLGIGDDVFLLTYQEMFGLLKDDEEHRGQSLSCIPARKASFARYNEYPTFPTLIIGGFDPDRWLSDPQRRNDLYCEDMDANGALAEVLASSDVKGFPGAAGKVEGTVRVISDIKDIGQIRKGDILVTTATNIGWTIAFSKVSAIVTDIGAPLSHAAIVAREFGIPAVVGCGNATTVLRTGDRVIVDGRNGTVRKVE